MRLVLFDFDGTLTIRDTIIPLGLFLSRTKFQPLWCVVRMAWLVMLLKARLLSNHAFKIAFCEIFLTGETTERIGELSTAFARDQIVPILNAETLAALRNHLENGDQIYLVSANFDFVLRALQDIIKVEGVIATEPEVANGRYTGRLASPTCIGRQKLTRVLECFEDEVVREAVAYGDSPDDGPLLAYVKTAIWV